MPQLRIERLAGTQGHLMTDRAPGRYLLAYLEEADGGYRIGGHDLEAGEADLILLGPEHALEPNGLRVDRASVIAFPSDALAPRRPDERPALPLPGDPRWPSVAASPARRTTVPQEERALWSSRFDLLAWEIENEVAGYRQAVRAQLTGLLIGAVRLSAPVGGEATVPVDPLMDEVLDVIEQSFGGRLSLEDVARRVGRSPRHLSRLIREITGETVMHWIDERRMEEARRLLLESNHTVETIADRVGYLDTGYFRRRFRRAHGTAPAEWRRGNA